MNADRRAWRGAQAACLSDEMLMMMARRACCAPAKAVGMADARAAAHIAALRACASRLALSMPHSPRYGDAGL